MPQERTVLDIKANIQNKQFIFSTISTYNNNNLNSGNFCEYDKLFIHRNTISEISTRNYSMKDDTYSMIEMEKNHMQIILEFPQKTNNEVITEKEVKSILTGIVQEYLTKSS